MINPDQINYLLNLCEVEKVFYLDKMPIGFHYPKEKMLSIDYNDFKKNMGLDDIHLHWLTSENAHIAGGAVLNWVWQEHKNSDIDFFFSDDDAFNRFRNLIVSYNFTEGLNKNENFAHRSPPTLCLVNSEDGQKTEVQLVGGTEWRVESGYDYLKLNPYSFPTETISRFDIRVCQMAVDCDNIYFTRHAVLDLLTKRLQKNENLKRKSEKIEFRENKYHQKGFGNRRSFMIKDDNRFNTVNIDGNSYLVEGELKDFNCYILYSIKEKVGLLTSITDKFGFPIRQYETKWGQFSGSDKEILFRV